MKIYGKRIASNILRSAGAIDRNFIWKQVSDDPVIDDGSTYDKSGASAERIISNPNQFFEYLCDCSKPFSHKSIVATLCLAKFQKNINQ